MKRLGVPLLGLAVAMLVLAAPAFGAGTVSRSGASAIFTGTAGADGVTISIDEFYVVFTGTAIKPGSGCEYNPQGDLVRCDKAGITGVVVNLGDGDDRLVNATGLTGTFDGGAGDDELGAGAGATPDDIRGGSGIDVVRYDTSKLNLKITLDDEPNDGAAGGGANVHGDVENVTAGSGNDRLEGDGGNNRLEGGPGSDTLIGYDGADALIGGDGDDTTFAVDGVADTVDCGAGNDLVSADSRDAQIDCEGVPAVKGPTPLVGAKIAASFKTGARTVVTQLVVTRAPAPAKIRVTCSGGKRKGCKFKAKSVAAHGATTSLTKLFKRAKLKPRVVVQVRVTRSGAIGRVFTFTMRKKKTPRLVTRCLSPGAQRPRACS
jgi:hypothetical protein